MAATVRTEHVVDIVKAICTEAGWTVLTTYTEGDLPFGVDITAYPFITSESETNQFEDARGFEITSNVMLYLDFRLNEFGQDYTSARNAIIQAFEDARITADLPLNGGNTLWEWSSQVPMITNVTGAIDDSSSRGVVDILLRINTWCSPK